MQNDEIEFPTPICSDTAPHAKHRIAGTWRTECPGVPTQGERDWHTAWDGKGNVIGSGTDRDQSLAPVHAFNRDIYAASSSAACGGQGWRCGDKNEITCPECKEIVARRAQTIEEAEVEIAALTSSTDGGICPECGGQCLYPDEHGYTTEPRGRKVGRRGSMPTVVHNDRTYKVRSRKTEIPDLDAMRRTDALLWLLRNTYPQGTNQVR